MHEKEIEKIKKLYSQGTRIKLLSMHDIQAPKPGTEGTVKNVDDIGTIHVDWDDGSSLGLIVGEDSFEII